LLRSSLSLLMNVTFISNGLLGRCGRDRRRRTVMGRRAKIVCTLGPATSSPDQIAALVAAGLDVARLKMSHGSQASHHAAYSNIRAAGDASGRSVGVLVDLQGPKIRLGRRCWTSGDVQGDLVVIVAGSPPGTPGRTNALRVHRIGDAVEI
jgi:pyruvate kinase